MLLAHKDQSLISHLMSVSQKAKSFADEFQSGEFGRKVGLLHDLGKAEDAFQKRIITDDKNKDDKKPHSHHGAVLAVDKNSWPIALAINGHHAGLHNRGDVDSKKKEYLEKAFHCSESIKSENPSWALPELSSKLPGWLSSLEYDPLRKSEGWLAAEMFTRMLFSALIDADRLDTEESEKGIEQSLKGRKWQDFNPESLLQKLEDDLNKRYNDAKKEGKASEKVLSVRQEVRDYCLNIAKSSRGIFTLAVPTGGGKTLASMLFALKHAAFHNQNLASGQRQIRRIIVVIPYLSIIQQTAKELKGVFGEDMVLEHHSQAEEPEDNKDKEPHDGKYDELSEKRRLAAENWDAPIIVTTSVQFFNSLFSRKPSSARKLHNICQSIIIFDEIQTLPPLLLQPILNVLSELSNKNRPYGCSLVFCTATQPALLKTDDLSCGLEIVTPIIPAEKAREHFQKLERVTYSWPEENKKISWNDLVTEIVKSENNQSLVVVNTRRAARELHTAIKKELGENCDGLFHLSTWMMPIHRVEVLNEVKRRLDTSERCILVSTQCIEAGVDVDFPEAWRAFGPYDSIVQVAGRCNRNGKISTMGKVHIFYPEEDKTPPGLYRTAIAQTELLRKMNKAKPEVPDSFQDYFRLLFQLSVPDECEIQKARGRFQFKEVDEMFQFIEDNSIPVLIINIKMNATEEKSLASDIYDQAARRQFFTREDWRSFQPYIINLPFHIIKDKTLDGKLVHSFDKESNLFVWEGVYRGGLSGFGIDFEADIIERMIL